MLAMCLLRWSLAESRRRGPFGKRHAAADKRRRAARADGPRSGSATPERRCRKPIDGGLPLARGVRVAHVSSGGRLRFDGCVESTTPRVGTPVRQIFDGAISRAQEIPYGRQSIRFRIEGTNRSTQRFRQSARQEGPSGGQQDQSGKSGQQGSQEKAPRKAAATRTDYPLPTRRRAAGPCRVGIPESPRHRNSWHLDGARRSPDCFQVTMMSKLYQHRQLLAGPTSSTAVIASTSQSAEKVTASILFPSGSRRKGSVVVRVEPMRRPGNPSSLAPWPNPTLRKACTVVLVSAPGMRCARLLPAVAGRPSTGVSNLKMMSLSRHSQQTFHLRRERASRGWPSPGHKERASGRCRRGRWRRDEAWRVLAALPLRQALCRYRLNSGPYTEISRGRSSSIHTGAWSLGLRGLDARSRPRHGRACAKSAGSRSRKSMRNPASRR